VYLKNFHTRYKTLYNRIYYPLFANMIKLKNF